MSHHGFVRVATAVPKLRVGDTAYNVDRIAGLMRRAQAEEVAVLCFPELSITGYTCADLFQQSALQRGAIAGLTALAQVTAREFTGLAAVGLPLVVDDQLFNCAALLHGGRVLGLVPKSFIPNYKEFYEGRWFAAAATARSDEVVLGGARVPFGRHLMFDATDVEGLVIGVEICEDLWVPVPPSSFQAARGATVLLNLSASNEVIGKSGYRRQLVINQSGRCMAAYAYASCGVWESTTDVVFGGHCLIAENGSLLGETPRFAREEQLFAVDVDLDRLRADRMRTNSFGDAVLYVGLERELTRVPFELKRKVAPANLKRDVDGAPFVPRASAELRERCEEIFHTQVAGLGRRLEHTGNTRVTIGVSGGLDSTLALLVVAKTMDRIGAKRSDIQAFTMPGFGTTGRTLANARALMKELGVTAQEVDIRAICLEEMRAMRHRPFGIDLTGLDADTLTEKLRNLPPDNRSDLIFENVQARMRTSILMNAGFVIGTGDLSELALGWCTYNGDHMSMYNPNTSIPKTLVKFLVKWVAENEMDGEVRRVLLDVFETEISPELLPTSADGKIVQSTESSIGPYELHDFFLYQVMRYGTDPAKVLYLASRAKFSRAYEQAEIRRWLAVFLKRFFSNQFKRSCLPDGPKVGSVSVSPRGDWRMPSDAQVALWLSALEGPGTH